MADKPEQRTPNKPQQSPEWEVDQLLQHFAEIAQPPKPADSLPPVSIGADTKREKGKERESEQSASTGQDKPRTFEADLVPDGKEAKVPESRERTAEVGERRDRFASPVDQLQQSRDRLEAAVKQAGLDVGLARNYMQATQDRAGDYWLTPQQVARSFDQVTDMITAHGGKWFNDRQMKDVGMQTLHNMAYPQEINQGSHPTCNVTTVEVYAASRRPELYAEMIKQVSLTGEWKSASGTVHVPRAAVMPGVDEKKFSLASANEDVRNHASEIAQNTLVNAVYQMGLIRKNGHKIDAQYVLGEQTKRREFRPGVGIVETIETEDRLLDKHGNQIFDRDGKAKRDPGFTGQEVQQAAKLLFGYEMTYLGAPYKIGNGPWHYDLPSSERMMNYKRNHQLPLGVHTMGGQHVQTVHNVKMEMGKCWVQIDNQHGKNQDGWITLDELHATQKSFRAPQPVRQYPGGPIKRGYLNS